MLQTSQISARQSLDPACLVTFFTRTVHRENAAHGVAQGLQQQCLAVHPSSAAADVPSGHGGPSHLAGIVDTFPALLAGALC
ncbi:hypothetical protein ACLQ18_44540 [Streptomyces sp. DT193]|uniref:hypothetical protein n=1 Tax=Streptomyces sp. DT193 TaxID=3393418 RepID=UPI003CF515B2